MLSLLLSSTLIFNTVPAAAGSEIITIHNANEFVQFSNNVNKGKNYVSATVFLDSDIDLSGTKFEPIGK